MRLINTTTLQLKFFVGDVPPYAILSHTWGEEEVVFQDMEKGTESASTLKGFAKIRGCCEQAVRDGYEWAWVDTCCIDKTSSSELSEAINSMYQWYKLSAICYVYVEDVEAGSNALPTAPASVLGIQPPDAARMSLSYNFSHSRWFKRGWTLQELIAPRCLEFYDRNWVEIGTKSSLASELRRITGIRAEVLAGGPMTRCCMAERMSWAANRETTKVEDRAYSLLGIFDVNMPLLYGEGPRAFIRLQEEILMRHEDLSLLAWNTSPLFSHSGSVLAPGPKGFTSVLTTYNPPLVRDERSPGRTQQGITWENVRAAPSPGLEAHSITSRGILATLFVDTPASHDVRHDPQDVLMWTNLIAEFDTPDEPQIRLCMLMRPRSGFIGPVSDLSNYTTLDMPESSRGLGMICVPKHAAKNFVPRKFYLPTQVKVPNPSTEWVVKHPWSMQGHPRENPIDPGYQSELNVLTFYLEPTAGAVLEKHHPEQLRRFEMQPGVYSVFIPAGGDSATVTRRVLFSCSRHRRGPGGQVTVDRFAVYFIATARRKASLLLCGCSVLAWTPEMDERGLEAQAITHLDNKQSSAGAPFGDRSQLRLEDGTVVAAAVKQHVQSVVGTTSFANVSLSVSVTEAAV
ncbi:HET domain-containing protein [Candidatus Bathyarchaeota archaeon]|nr:HET domain-containing protein [Candidatus Bathyarchaeota archaeon]